jgi:hypothetical protein
VGGHVAIHCTTVVERLIRYDALRTKAVWMNTSRRSSHTVDRTRRLRATRTERALISRYVHELAGDAKRAVRPDPLRAAVEIAARR